MRYSSLCALLAVTACRATPVMSVPLPNPAPATPLPVAADALPLLAVERIQALPHAERDLWVRYIARSDSARGKDRALLEGELKSLAKTAMDSAPYVRESFTMSPAYTDGWLRTDGARRVAEAIVSFQTPSGGWSKHVDFTRGLRRAGQSFYGENSKWQFIATIDNDATTSQLRYLLALDRVKPDAAWQASITRGLSYLMAAQMPNGCWPQVWPLQGGYHDAITFNDDAVVTVARLLADVVEPGPSWLPVPLRDSVAQSVSRAEQCVLRTQVQRNGRRTVWGQQHDPLTLKPVRGRSYELASFASKESAALLDWLITRPSPSPELVAAVDAGAQWLRDHAAKGQQYDINEGVTAAPETTLLWARLYDLDTETPLFANRDGIPLQRFDQLTDRRVGYAWYGTWPRATLNRIAKWRAARK